MTIMNKHLIVHHDEMKHKAALKSIEKCYISERNKQLILDFALWLKREGISYKRVSKYLYHLKFIGKWLGKDFDTAEKEDIMEVVDKIDENGYTYNTIYDYKIAINHIMNACAY